MISLGGTLEGIGLPALVRFLAGLRSSGLLLVADDSWGGEVGFDEGRVVAAAFGAERGLAALEAIALALPRGEFRFAGGAIPEGRDVDLPPEDLERYLTSLAEEQVALARAIPSLASVPRPVDPGPDGAGAPERITIDRSTLFSLLLVDGRRTVQALCEQRGERGAAQTLKELAWLAGSGLVVIDPPPPAAPEDPRASPPDGPDAPPPDGPGAPPPAPALEPAPAPATPPLESPTEAPGPRTSAFVAGPASPGALALAGGPGPQAGWPGGGLGAGPQASALGGGL
ncbi:MAG TPA: DUF4388 domain-containing protein, partial [Chloroflexota bacterium]|nr:DUF4388 domain-containing protein [Chloroflexota bacterium]